MTRPRIAITTGIVLAVVSIAAGLFVLWHPGHRHEPMTLSTSLDQWQEYEGSWASAGGILTDVKGGRGDKLITGDAALNDLVFSGDLRFDSARDFDFGDAGFVVRASNIYVGTDSMYGYYAGIAPGTQSLKLGRMLDDYTDLAVVKLKRPVRIGEWYHLSVRIHECRLEVHVEDPRGEVAQVDFYDQGCVVRAGRVGLRVYSMVASWRDLMVEPLS